MTRKKVPGIGAVLIGALTIISGVIWNLRAESARPRPA